MEKRILRLLLCMAAIQIVIFQGVVWGAVKSIPKEDFFKELMGSYEAKWVEDNLATLGRNPGDLLVQQAIKAKLGDGVGVFESKSIQELRDATAHIKKNGQGALFKIIRSDGPDANVAIDALQANKANNGACFMIASRFHALEKNANRNWWKGEGNGPSLKTIRQKSSEKGSGLIIPNIFLGDTQLREDKTFGSYPSLMEAFYKGTQGETAAASAAPATIWRMYGADAFDEVKDLGITLDPVGTFGYADSNIAAIDALLKGIASLEDIKKSTWLPKICIGIHTDARVSYSIDPTNSKNFICVEPGQKIMQVFVSAINLKVLKHQLIDDTKEENLAKFFLYAAFEGTLRAAAAKEKQKVFLTLIGGLAFQNDLKWIVECVKAMNDIIWDLGLDVTMNCYTEKQDSYVCKELGSFKIVKPEGPVPNAKKINTAALKQFLRGKPFATRTAFYEYSDPQNRQCLFSLVEGNLQDQKFLNNDGICVTNNKKIPLAKIVLTVAAGLDLANAGKKQSVAVSMTDNDEKVLADCEKWLSMNPEPSIEEVRFVKQKGVSSNNNQPFFDNALNKFKKFTEISDKGGSLLQTNLKNLADSMKKLKGKLGEFSGKLGELKDKITKL